MHESDGDDARRLIQLVAAAAGEASWGYASHTRCARRCTRSARPKSARAAPSPHTSLLASATATAASASASAYPHHHHPHPSSSTRARPASALSARGGPAAAAPPPPASLRRASTSLSMAYPRRARAESVPAAAAVPAAASAAGANDPFARFTAPSARTKRLAAQRGAWEQAAAAAGKEAALRRRCARLAAAAATAAAAALVAAAATAVAAEREEEEAAASVAAGQQRQQQQPLAGHPGRSLRAMTPVDGRPSPSPLAGSSRPPTPSSPLPQPQPHRRQAAFFAPPPPVPLAAVQQQIRNDAFTCGIPNRGAADAAAHPRRLGLDAAGREASAQAALVLPSQRVAAAARGAAAAAAASPPPAAVSVSAPLARDLALERLGGFFRTHAGVCGAAAAALAHEAYAACAGCPRRLSAQLAAAYPAHEARFGFVEEWAEAERASGEEEEEDAAAVAAAESPTQAAEAELRRCRRRSSAAAALSDAGAAREEAAAEPGGRWKTVAGELRWCGSGSARGCLRVVDARLPEEEEGAAETDWATGRTTVRHGSLGAALRAACEGDSVSVLEGAYEECAVATVPVHIYYGGRSRDAFGRPLAAVVTAAGGGGGGRARPALTVAEGAGHTVVEGLSFAAPAAAASEGAVLVCSRLAEVRGCTVTAHGPRAALRVAGASRAVVERCTVRNTGRGSGVHLVGRSRAVVRACTVTGCGAGGVVVEGVGTAPLVEGCSIVRGRGSGVVFGKKAGGVLRACTVSDNACLGVLVEGGSRPAVEGCVVGGNGGGGVRFVGRGTRGVASGNTFEENLERGAFVTEGAAPHLLSNRFRGGSFGVVWAHGGGGVMEGCAFEGFEAYCCASRDGGRPVCAGNTLRFSGGCGGAAGGFAVCDGGRVFLRGNTFVGPAKAAVPCHGGTATMKGNTMVAEAATDEDEACGDSSESSCTAGRLDTPSPLRQSCF